MRYTLKALFAALIMTLFVMQPVSSYADWHNHNGGNGHGGGYGHNGGHGHGGWHGHSYVGLNLSIWPDSYYYGAFYYPPTDAVLVSPPIYEPVVVNGVTYYLYDGAYYIYNGYSYQPVAPPVTVAQPQPVTVIQPPAVTENQVQGTDVVITNLGTASDIADSFTINIPNDKGGYTAVTLKKSGNGFIGPQGEFYTKFPSVSQLKVMYGK